MKHDDEFDCMEGFIRRLILPLVGIAGIIYEELQGGVDAALLGVYLSLVGLGAVPWVRDLAGRRNSDGSTDKRT